MVDTAERRPLYRVDLTREELEALAKNEPISAEDTERLLLYFERGVRHPAVEAWLATGTKGPIPWPESSS